MVPSSFRWIRAATGRVAPDSRVRAEGSATEIKIPEPRTWRKVRRGRVKPDKVLVSSGGVVVCPVVCLHLCMAFTPHCAASPLHSLDYLDVPVTAAEVAIHTGCDFVFRWVRVLLK